MNQLHPISAYIVPGETLTPRAARVRYYTARAVGDVVSADYLLHMGIPWVQQRTVRIAYEVTL